ncbi:hypothetical protein NIE88_02010 [Sporolactobacillus shoreicorticis]|uniref:DUF3899 domain-containing protein n=1 Tax=Sporolactobacillus shoreicorticis TaxID=1923877 RepID=A0ABW5S2M1_9BACL|nr:hypothetical protein [Sporolactobacillus shoreicorticis]MCO7124554.1 hypothetical protein [Sporolactobacillus shoreicorticis]
MAALIIAILFWILGMAALCASFYVTKEMREKGEHLLKESEHEKGKDDSASIAMAIEAGFLKRIPSYVIHLVTGTVGATLIVFGFVALAFYFH